MAWLLVIAVAGDISKLNCPTSFTVATENVTTSAQQSIINIMTPFYNLLRGTGNAHRVEDIIVNGNSADLDPYVFSMSLPFIGVGAAFLITYCIIISCCVFQKSCPPCQSWKRDFGKRPYQKA